MIDPDPFQGGRKQENIIGGKSLGVVENLEGGKWLEQDVGPERTSEGKVLVEARNARAGANAVISIIEWVELVTPKAGGR